MIVQQQNFFDKRNHSTVNMNKDSKLLSSIVLDQQIQLQRQQLPIVIGNNSAYVSPKQITRRTQVSQEKKNSVAKVEREQDPRIRGRFAKIQQQMSEIRPKTANPKHTNNSQFYSFYVDKGNNSQLVRKILSRRSWLYEATTITTVNIRWKQTSKDFNFSSLGTNQIGTQRKISINHLEHHPEITTKTRLFLNLKVYAKKMKENINEFVPATYLINLDSSTFQNELKEFIDNFCKIKQGNTLRNIWLLKPPDLNRGQGIQLFNDIRIFINQLQEYGKAKQNLKSSRLLSVKPQMKNVIITYPADKSDPNKDSHGMTTATFLLEQMIGNQGGDRVVVLQKYLENPYLYNGRKFDFRVWVLVDHNLNYYFFREGYLRLASDPFDTSTQQLRNKFIHLTNNAIQKHHERYGKFELGNQLSFSDLQNYFQHKGQKFNVRDKVVNRMKELVKITINSAAERLATCTRQYQYEIYGYDFMIDSSCNIWLIEINTNPCIEESSPLLQKLIPRMLSNIHQTIKDDAFRLTIDKIFPPAKQEQIDEILGDFIVPGYNQVDNLWEPLGKIGR